MPARADSPGLGHAPVFGDTPDFGDPPVFGVETINLDLPAVAGAFSRRLYRAGLPLTTERAAAFAAALTIVEPITRRQLYWTARAVFVSDPAHVRAFDAVFGAVFGAPAGALAGPRAQAPPDADLAPAPPDERPGEERDSAHGAGVIDPRAADASTPAPPDPDAARDERDEREQRDLLVPMGPSDEEVLRDRRFDTLEPHELAQLYRLMARLELATPLRRMRRSERHARGERIDMRRTLRASMHTAGDPIRLTRRRRRVRPRRIVLLCDISGSMEPYARAYLQFLTCAAGASRRHRRAEAFVFATRLTRLTRALASRNPERAIAQAAAEAPDWSSGTRIGDALKTFNDRHGRRGMARGAVIVILSDGWERGDPALVGREMERLARLAHRIVWVNPRAAAPGFSPRAGGMRAALAHCDALVAGHTLRALEAVADAIGADRPPAAAWSPASEGSPRALPDEEAWGSATPVAGSSVAMPSGYGPSRGRTTPGWGIGR